MREAESGFIVLFSVDTFTTAIGSVNSYCRHLSQSCLCVSIPTLFPVGSSRSTKWLFSRCRDFSSPVLGPLKDIYLSSERRLWLYC